MGDRANVLIRPTGVWLYCHSWGIEIPYVVRDTLHSWRDRWKDPGTLASLVFCAMVERYRRFLHYPISFHIGTRPLDLDHADLVLDTEAQTVSFEDRGPPWRRQPAETTWRGSFESYAALVDEDLRKLLVRIKYGGDEVREWVPTQGLK